MVVDVDVVLNADVVAVVVLNDEHGRQEVQEHDSDYVSVYDHDHDHVQVHDQVSER